MSNLTSSLLLLIPTSPAAAVGTPRITAAAPTLTRVRRCYSARVPAATVTGTVTTDVSHLPIVGAQVTVIGTAIAAVTDAEGRYRLLNVPAGTFAFWPVTSGTRPVSDRSHCATASR